MTALDRARSWFVAPPPSRTVSGWSAPPTPPHADDPSPSARQFAPPCAAQVTDRPGAGTPSSAVRATFAPPVATCPDDPAPGTTAATVALPSPSAGGSTDSAAAVPPARARRGKRPPRPQPREPAVQGAWQPPEAGDWVTAPSAASATVTSAAVLGRPGEVEPVAAALALALRLQTRAKAAAVAVVGAIPPEVELGSAGAAARRLGARLEAQGLQPHVRGRLAWVELDPDDPQFVSAARRVTLVAAPAVLAVSVARTVAVDEALNEQDLLVIVSAEPEGPLAQLAAAGLTGVPILTVRPLGRGPARALARAGVRSARPVRQLLTTVPEVAG